MRYCIATCLFIGLLAMAAATPKAVTSNGPDQAKSGSVKILRKSDLRIFAFKSERTGLNPDGSHNVRLSVTVANFGSACGPFKVHVGSSYGKGPWATVGEGGIRGLGKGYDVARIPTETLVFNDSVPSGRTRNYLATADSSNAIDESNETNNTAMISYAATGCTGSDLELTQVEMIRSRTGGVLFRVWVRNRCLVDCEGDITYTVTPLSSPLDATVQGISSNIPGETTAGPLGSMVAPGRAGVALSYEVTISVRGGTCRETSTANNTCRVTIGAREDRKVVTCRH